MPDNLIIGSAAALLMTLLYFEKEKNPRGILPSKTLLSSLFVLAVLVQPHPISRYYHFIAAGLVMCLIGDVFLAVPRKKMFFFGLVSFLLGHIFYCAGFLTISGAIPGAGLVLSIVSVLGGIVYIRLMPHLGSMKIHVLVYVIVISIMLILAWSVMGNTGLTRTSRALIFTGALSFYVSDMLVARDRFYKNEFINRIIGLPLYYAGQFLLAFSVGFP